MKRLIYSFVIVSVVLLALLTISELSTAQNKGEIRTESEGQKWWQITDNIWTQFNYSALQQEHLERTNNTARNNEVDSILNSYLAESRFAYGSILDSAVNIFVPGVPTLIAPANGATVIANVATQFSWNSVIGATGYELQFNSEPVIDRGTSLSFTLISSTLGAHTWKVRATDATGAGAWSTARSFTIVSVPTVAPTLIAPANGATVIANVSTQFTWSTVTGATGYDLQYNSEPIIDRGSSTSFSLISNTLGAHTWRARGKNAAGAGPWSAARSFTVVSAPTVAPTLIAPANGATVIANVSTQFSWSTVTGATGYDLQYNSEPIIDRGTSTSFSLISNTLGAHTWRARGKNAAGAGPWSAARSFTVVSAPTVAPTLIAPANGATVIANVSTQFSWSTVTGATGYDLQYNSEPIIDRGSSTSFSLISNTLGAHTWRARGKNAAGVGPWSAARSFTVVSDIPTVAPTLIAPANGATVIANVSTQFSWSTVTGATGYDLQYNSEPIIDRGSSTSFSLISNTLGAHTWRARGKNAAGVGPWSTARSFTVVFNLSAPTLIAPADGATVIANVSTTFSWNPVTGATGYDLQYNAEPIIDRGSSTSFDLISNTLGAHTWKVRAKNAAGVGPWSTARSFTVVSNLSAPTLIAPADGATVIANVATTFSWSTVAGATGYDLQYNAEPIIDRGSSTSFDLISNTLGAHTWRARAKTASGAGPWSTARSFTVVSNLSAPTLIAPADGATVVANVSTTFSWSTVAGATGYDLQYNAEPIIDRGSSTSFSLISNTLGAHTWRARAKTASGAGPWSTARSFTIVPATPAVFSITPSTPTSAPSDQDISVSGSNFKPGLTVDITAPGGGVTTLSGAQIQNVNNTSFIMRATLSAAGSWSIKVKNPDNQQSAAFPFPVASGGPSPFITSINPVSPTANGADQYVTVTGGNFQNGLMVNATFPNGGISTLQGTGQIQNVTATSFKLKITLNTDGAWKIRVVNPDNTQSSQFAFTVQPSGPPPTGLPTSVLSPVIGPLRIIPPNSHASDGKWEFDQHKTGSHTATGGISLSNDTYAWDADLFTPTNTNADAGKAVFATAAGQVVSYVSTPPGGGPGAVLIAHPNAANPVWFSGYKHMANVLVTLNQVVDTTTLIGEVVPAGAPNDHLHFVVYSGTNTRGNLQSFNTVINERSSVNVPTISSITPSAVIQGVQPQSITINGANFASDSIVEGETPNGQSFPVTTATISPFGDNSRITHITASTITANVTFQFPGAYKFRVINRSTGAMSSGSCPQICVDVIPLTIHRTPVILIPGIMGSKIEKRIGPSFVELFPSIPGPVGSIAHGMLKDNVVVSPTPISQRPVVATEILRSYLFGYYDYYGHLIDWLTGLNEGYVLYNVTDPIQRTSAGCDTHQTGANLFVFPYDWRNSNAISARDLRDYVGCIAQIRYGNDPIPADFKVNIIAHSMGGLVARRYILDGNHHVDKMVTLGAPWLGAPKSILTLEDGTFKGVNRLIVQPVLKEIAPFLKGAHELIPSKAYVDELVPISDRPLGEEGWQDFDFDSTRNTPASEFTFNRLRITMNVRYPREPSPRTYPGETTNAFHSQPGQDDWRERSNTGVTYYPFIGVGEETIGALIAKESTWRGKILDPVYTFGDGTVPDVSARLIGRQDYRGTEVKPERYFPVSHSDLASKFIVFPSILCVVNNPNPDNCLSQLPPGSGFAKSDSIVNEPTYSLRVIGSNSVNISDSFGNTTDPLSTSFDEGVQTITTNVTGDNFLSATFPLDQNYKVVLKVPATPFSVILTKSDGQTITQAIRYVDITLPPNVLALIQITPQGVTTLAYDSDGNGTFDTQVNPTINVTGTPAQDIEAPQLHINETVQGGSSRIDLDATDAGTGVQKIMYSLNGTTFQQYSAPLTLNAATTPTIYVYADDNVFNRSGLVTHTLTVSNVGFSVAGPTIANTGGQITASWNAPNGRPVDDWIGLFQIGELNSRFIAKQYTNGLPSGGLTFTAPNQPGLYEFRYLVNDSFSSVAVSNTINVISNRPAPFDFDGDGKTDPAVFRPTNGYWYLLQSTAGFLATPFGTNGDRLVPGDYDNDGKTDTAVWRPSNGYWYILSSSNGSFRAEPFGLAGDIPAAGDYDGDNKTDIAVWRPSDGYFYLLFSSDGSFQFKQWGQAGDMPVMGDYDGDGRTDFAIFRPSIGTFYVLRSSDGGVIGQQFGQSGDKPIAGDFDGDGKTDIAVYRPSSSSWYWLQSSDNGFRGVAWGTSEDIPSAGDYDGDGKWDVAVFRPSSGTFYILQSTTNALRAEQFGTNGDVPVPSAFVP